MYNFLKKFSIVLICTVIVMFLVAAGVDEAGIVMAESINETVQSLTSSYVVVAGLLSAWLFTIGMMCKTLEKIPGVTSGRAGSKKKLIDPTLSHQLMVQI